MGSTVGSSPTARMGLGISPSSNTRLRWRRAGSAIGTAANLGAEASKAAVVRAGLDANLIEEVLMGCVLQ